MGKPYRVELDRRAAKEIAALTVDVQARLLRAIAALARTPRPAGVVKLEGAQDLYRIRIGAYRVLYRVWDDVLIILVVRVGHRREVYRREPD